MTRGDDDWTRTGEFEQVELREGMSLVLSDFPAHREATFHHVETEDYFGIGFHLVGGSRFAMEDVTFATKPMAVHAGGAPRGSGASFALSRHGFRTVSIRFAPDSAVQLFETQTGVRSSRLIDMAIRSRADAVSQRLPSLDQHGATLVGMMLDNPYDGPARSLFLESCAMGLIAGQLDPARHIETAKTTSLDVLVDARAYLDAHLSSPPTILELARICGTNDFKLKRDFKAAFGTTIFGYVRKRRMEKAAADLDAGLSVGKAASQAGYLCTRSFADAFRRHFGVLPSELTRGVLANDPAYRR